MQWERFLKQKYDYQLDSSVLGFSDFIYINTICYPENRNFEAMESEDLSLGVYVFLSFIIIDMLTIKYVLNISFWKNIRPI